ncbi:hypothetical protein [Myroides sp. LJL119]
MIKLTTKIKASAIVFALVIGLGATSCSKDDNSYQEPQEEKVSIDLAVGTYKGTISSGGLDQYNYYDAVITVTKQADNKLKVTPKLNEPYSTVTPKTFTVKGEVVYDGNSKSYYVNSLPASVEGYLFYYQDNKTIEIQTRAQSESDIEFYFEGVKQ